ncbi:nuclear polyadenylated RNA-binding protein 4 [Monosporozyma servazzii]
MSSDEEDFNDIYGDDEPTTTTVEETKPNETTEEAEKKLETSSEQQQNAESNSNSNNNVSSLDQLAALQALSSNLNQINNSADKDGNNATATTDSNQNNDANTNAESKPALPWEQLQQTMSQFNPQQGQQQQQSQQETEDQRRVKADISKDSCKMFIGGLNWETTEEGLRNYFNKYGHVTDLKIMKDPSTGRSRGFGFLTFEIPSSVDEVVKTQHILDGKVIDPKRSIPREEQDKTGKIFVGGIGADVRPREFEEFFARYGNIIDAQLMLDKDTGRSRGFGFVTYDSPEAVDRVCESKYIEFKGKQIEIKRAEPRHLQKGQYGGANPHNRNSTGYGPQSTNMGSGSNNVPLNTGAAAIPGAAGAAAMYQNPMMAGGFNPMMAGGFNPQAMQDYYQKMQEYYTQMQQQTGIDYTQMYQQQMQQMAMMMPGFAMPGQMPALGSLSPPGGMDNGSSSNDVQTIGDNNENNNNNNNDDGGDDDRNSNDSASNTPEVNIPRGPKDPSSIPSHHGGYQHRERGDRGDRNDRNDRGGDRRDNGDRRDRRRGGYRGGNNNNYRGGYRGGNNRRSNNGYHPYNRQSN